VKSRITDNRSSRDVRHLYDSRYFTNLPTGSQRIAQILSRVKFHPDARVCEFGCGTGDFLFAIQHLVGYGLGIDYVAHAVQRAQTRSRTAAVSNVEFLCGDIREMTARPGLLRSFDEVLMMDFTEHVPDAELLDYFGVARQLLKTTGRIVVHTPNARYYLERLKSQSVLKQLPGHIAVRSESAYVDLLGSAGYVVKQIHYLPHYHAVLGRIDRLAMAVPGLASLFQSRLLVEASPKLP